MRGVALHKSIILFKKKILNKIYYHLFNMFFFLISDCKVEIRAFPERICFWDPQQHFNGSLKILNLIYFLFSEFLATENIYF